MNLGLMCTALCALFVSACGQMVTTEPMAPRLDARVGQVAPKGNLQEFAYARRQIDATSYELESRRPDACNYILTVRRDDDVITGWRYVTDPPPSDCRFQTVRELM